MFHDSFSFQAGGKASNYKRVRGASDRKSVVALKAEGEIFVWIDGRYILEQFDEISNTGNSPEPIWVNGTTFYHVAPGSGAVDYPDDYILKLRGEILHIEFDGPYIDDNKPSECTKNLEPQLPATFRTF